MTTSSSSSSNNFFRIFNKWHWTFIFLWATKYSSYSVFSNKSIKYCRRFIFSACLSLISIYQKKQQKIEIYCKINTRLDCEKKIIFGGVTMKITFHAERTLDESFGVENVKLNCHINNLHQKYASWHIRQCTMSIERFHFIASDFLWHLIDVKILPAPSCNYWSHCHLLTTSFKNKLRYFRKYISLPLPLL